jgi:hypothetical protein
MGASNKRNKVILRLVFMGEQQIPAKHQLAEGKNTVGRTKSSMISIRDDSVSRAHGEILTWGTEVIVRDLGSRNGTWVGGRLLKNSQAPVRFGETIRFGSVEVRLEADPPAVGRASLDDAMDDVTAFRHYSQMMHNRAGVCGDTPSDAQPQTWAEFALLDAECPDSSGQTLMIVRSEASELCARS